MRGFDFPGDELTWLTSAADKHGEPRVVVDWQERRVYRSSRGNYNWKFLGWGWWKRDPTTWRSWGLLFWLKTGFIGGEEPDHGPGSWFDGERVWICQYRLEPMRWYGFWAGKPEQLDPADPPPPGPCPFLKSDFERATDAAAIQRENGWVRSIYPKPGQPEGQGLGGE